MAGVSKHLAPTASRQHTGCFTSRLPARRLVTSHLARQSVARRHLRPSGSSRAKPRPSQACFKSTARPSCRGYAANAYPLARTAAVCLKMRSYLCFVCLYWLHGLVVLNTPVVIDHYGELAGTMCPTNLLPYLVILWGKGFYQLPPDGMAQRQLSLSPWYAVCALLVY